LFGNAGNNNAFSNVNPENELINKFPIDPNMNCIVLLNGGRLFIEDTMLSLK
jgi:F-box protein 11